MDDEITQAAPSVSPWIFSLSVVSATFMQVLDSSVLNVSLPHIAGSMSATVEKRRCQVWNIQFQAGRTCIRSRRLSIQDLTPSHGMIGLGGRVDRAGRV